MLSVQQVTKSYSAGQPVLRNISLEVAQGEVLCLLGPSGCGKSTLLRIIAGLEEAEEGALLVDGRNLTTIPVHRRHFGLMFQDFALFPHRTVAENVAFGLRMAGMARSAIGARVAEVLGLVSLRGYEERSVFALSGGERQRVALARSLAPNPRLLMLDEPLGSLDRTLRDDLVTELRAILKAIHVTAIYVTHDQQEAFTIADRLAVMRKGEIEQIAAPMTVYEQPANAFVARFLGFHNLLPLDLAPSLAAAVVQPRDIAADQPALLLIRPDAVIDLRQGPGEALPGSGAENGAPTIVGEVVQLAFLGASYRVVLTYAGENRTGAGVQRLSFDIPTIQIAPHLALLSVGASITLLLDPTAIRLIRP